MKHIEFLGIAGSGKSSVRSALCARNRPYEHLLSLHTTTVVETVLPPMLVPLGHRLPAVAVHHLCRISGMADRGVNYFRMNHPNMFETAGRFLREYSDDPNRRDNVSRRLLTMIEQFGVISEYGTFDNTLLLDEGFAFSAASVLHPPASQGLPADADIKDYLDHIPVPDALIHLRISPEMCIHRINTRPKGPPISWASLNQAERKRQAEDATHVADRIAVNMAERGTTVIELNTEDTSIGSTVRLAETRLLEAGLLDE